MSLRRFALPVLMVLALATAACGGGGGGGGSVPSYTPTTVPTQGLVTQTLPAATFAGGYSASITVNANGTLTDAISTAAPTGITRWPCAGRVQVR